MTKTDFQIQRDVVAELAWEPSVDASCIKVEVRGGVVGLSGRVGTYTEKWRAACAIGRVGGVIAMVGEIAVALAETAVRSDADIARAAQNVIEWITYLPVGSVYVSVENGWVTLAGQVDWPFQKEGAEHAIASLIGVFGISNQIELSNAGNMTSFKAAIEAALERCSQTDSTHVSVEIMGSDVTLYGTVRSLPERFSICQIARAMPGSGAVVDLMTVLH